MVNFLYLLGGLLVTYLLIRKIIPKKQSIKLLLPEIRKDRTTTYYDGKHQTETVYQTCGKDFENKEDAREWAMNNCTKRMK